MSQPLKFTKWVRGYYTPTPAFQAIPEHVAVMRESDGGLIAVCGPVGDKGSEADARLFSAAPVMLAELVRVRNGMHCQATSADINGDICQVTFTCGGCRRRAELSKIIADATGENL